VTQPHCDGTSNQATEDGTNVVECHRGARDVLAESYRLAATLIVIAASCRSITDDVVSKSRTKRVLTSLIYYPILPTSWMDVEVPMKPSPNSGYRRVVKDA
jgi:hypothetical protein